MAIPHNATPEELLQYYAKENSFVTRITQAVDNLTDDLVEIAKEVEELEEKQEVLVDLYDKACELIDLINDMTWDEEGEQIQGVPNPILMRIRKETEEIMEDFNGDFDSWYEQKYQQPKT